MQSRYGPNRVGPFGLLQPIADAIKLIQKEALTPIAADRWVMYVAPLVFVAPAVLLWAVIPFGPNMVIADIPVALLYYLAVASLPALNEMVVWQREHTIWIVLLQPLAFVIFFIAVSAELNRTPVDIAEAESEIVAGYLTEYSGMKWGLFYGMDIGYALAASALAATLFLGGWSMFGLDKWVPPWLILIGKTHAFYFLFIWTRGTLPRLRIDQLLEFAWKFLLPVAALNLLLIATERLVLVENEWTGDDWIYWVLAAINIAVAVAVMLVWARVLGYRPERVPVRARLVGEARGYVPVEGGS
jgi:NADH-quinone oxidoreductase subunit H